jgi:uncharacterized ParB-like nuclease family protein
VRMLHSLHLNVHAQAEKAQAEMDFSRARRQALLRWIWAFLRRDFASNQLLSFEEVKGSLRAVSQVYLGLRMVPLDKIVGSVGRYTDFDRAFLPSKGHLAERWKRIDRMMRRSGELPPVDLYKVGEAYFVLDGNHRISVARYHGVGWIDAQVTGLRGRGCPETRRRLVSREHRVDRQDRRQSKVRKVTARSGPHLRSIDRCGGWGG